MRSTPGPGRVNFPKSIQSVPAGSSAANGSRVAVQEIAESEDSTGCIVSAGTPGVLSLPERSGTRTAGLAAAGAGSATGRDGPQCWFDEAGGPAFPRLHPQDTGLQEQLIVKDAGILQTAAQGRDRRTGHQRLRVRPQRHVQGRLAIGHAPRLEPRRSHPDSTTDHHSQRAGHWPVPALRRRCSHIPPGHQLRLTCALTLHLRACSRPCAGLWRGGFLR